MIDCIINGVAKAVLDSLACGFVGWTPEQRLCMHRYQLIDRSIAVDVCSSISLLAWI